MIKENLDYLNRMIAEKRELYAIFSFLSETIDTMRTHLMDIHSTDDEIYAPLTKIVQELERVDSSINKKS